MKKCTKCDKEKNLDDFPKSSGRDGLSSWCRECHHQRYKGNRMKLDNERLEFAVVNPIAQLEQGMIEKGVSIRELAEAIGVNEINVGKWFNRKTMPRQKHLKAMYDFLDVEIPLILKAGTGGRLPLTVAKCANCGKEFPVYKAGVKFCSRECSGKDLSSRQLGQKNAMWKGGEIVTGHTGGGYIKELAPNNPNADASGYVLQHRLVMEQVIGRPLERHERVHHKNGDRQDNRPENLELWVGVERSKKDPHGVRLVDKVIDMLSSLQQHELLLVQMALEDKLHEFYIQSS